MTVYDFTRTLFSDPEASPAGAWMTRLGEHGVVLMYVTGERGRGWRGESDHFKRFPPLKRLT